MNRLLRKELKEVNLKITSLITDVAYIRDSEFDSFLNMPDSLQHTERAEVLQYNVDLLHSASDKLIETLEVLNNIK